MSDIQRRLCIAHENIFVIDISVFSRKIIEVIKIYLNKVSREIFETSSKLS